MDLRQMRYFLALAEEGHFGRAAERLHMAQPPLTRTIRALEEELGTPLFRRTPKGAELTAAGQALLEDVPNVLALARRARDKAQLAGQGMTGQLDIGIFGSGMLDVIPRLIARFREQRPQVRIALHNQTKAEQIAALREGRITLGFNRLVPREPDLAVETVMRERLIVGLPATHPLAAQAEIALRELDGLPLILYPNLPLPGLAQQVAAAFQKEKLRLNAVQSVEDVLTCIALVASGFGLCITTESAASLQLPGVVYRPLRARHLRDIELSVLYRRGDDSPLLAAFLAEIREFSAGAAKPGRRAGRASSMGDGALRGPGD